MQVTSKPRLSLWEKVDLWYHLYFLGPPNLGFHGIKNLIFAGTRGFSVKYYFKCAVLRILFSLSGRQVQHLHPASPDTYTAWVASKRRLNHANPAALDRLMVDIQSIPGRSANIFWLGKREAAKKVVLYLHGGGYFLPLTDGYCNLCWNTFLQPLVEGREGDEVAVAIVEYTLVPSAKYPSQIWDAAAALPLLFEQGFKPRDIVVGGDSAGGNLTMALLHHLVAPHPDLPRVELEEPFAGVFVVSPWLGLECYTPSTLGNKHDMLNPKILVTNSRSYLTDEVLRRIQKSKESGSQDGWDINPFGVEESWLGGLERATSRLYITAGLEEVLLDHAVDLASKLKRVQSAVDVQLDLAKGEAHDWLLLEGGDDVVGAATQRLRGWVQRVMEL